MPLSNDLFFVQDILKGAKAETLEGKNCFVLKWTDFLDVYEVAHRNGLDGDESSGLRAAGYNNFQLAISVKDEKSFFVVAASEPILTQIWEKTYKEKK